jgi:hypothetical protein
MSGVPLSRPPRAGDLLQIGPAASVQFLNPITVRVIRLHDWPMAIGDETGWVWMDVYQLNESGDAVLRRSVYVNSRGLCAPPKEAGHVNSSR